MPRERTPMQLHREIIRLAFQLQLSANEIHRATKLSRGAVQTCIKKANAVGLTWPLPDNLTDQALEEILYPRARKTTGKYALPDFEKIQSELRRKGVTLALLWDEYREEHPNDFYCYAHYAKLYNRWLGKKDFVMRQSHTPGEKLFVDFAGQTIPLICRETGEITQAQIFVATLGASNYTYAEGCLSQDLRNWLNLHIHAFRFFGGTPKLLVPDNLKSAVTEARRFDPTVNKSYQRLAKHYDCGIVPARPYKPRDKAKVEKGVQTVEQWILARLRNHTFFSIHDLNQAIDSLLKDLNDEPFQKMSGCRRSRFEEIEKNELKELPNKHFELEDWTSAKKVPRDYHVMVDEHYYSVPYSLVSERVDVRLTDTIIEIFHQNTRVASHLRSWASGEKTTSEEHMTPSHSAYHGMSAEKFLAWAREIGPATEQIIAIILASKPFPQLCFDQCFGVLGAQVKQHGRARVELACAHALTIGNPSYRLIKLLVQHDLENAPQLISHDLTGICHPNIRGPEHFT